MTAVLLVAALAAVLYLAVLLVAWAVRLMTRPQGSHAVAPVSGRRPAPRTVLVQPTGLEDTRTDLPVVPGFYRDYLSKTGRAEYLS